MGSMGENSFVVRGKSLNESRDQQYFNDQMNFVEVGVGQKSPAEAEAAMLERLEREAAAHQGVTVDELHRTMADEDTRHDEWRKLHVDEYRQPAHERAAGPATRAGHAERPRVQASDLTPEEEAELARFEQRL